MDNLNPINIPDIPMEFDWFTLRRILIQMRTAIIQLQGEVVPPRPIDISTFLVTPVSGGNFIQFERTDGDGYTLYWSLSNDFSSAFAIDLGTAASYTDNAGQGAVTRFYWVQAYKNQGRLTSDVTGPVSGVTLALGTAVVLPAPPPPSDSSVVNDETGYLDRSGRLGT